MPTDAPEGMAATMILTLVAATCAGTVLQMPRGYTIPLIDLSADAMRQIVVDREPGQYLGHVTTVLLEDGRTILAVYPKGHGRGAIVYKRSDDGGLTWSERLPVPENWSTSLEVPTLFRVIDPTDGHRRLIMFSGLYPIRMAVSEDDGQTWSSLEPIGEYGGIVAMGDVIRLKDGRYLAMFHDDGRFFRPEPREQERIVLFQVLSDDGGLTWSDPIRVLQHPVADPCEPGFARSPDGNQICAMLRENRRVMNSLVIFKMTRCNVVWPRELPGSHWRPHGAIRTDGRLVVVFRDMATTRQLVTPAWSGPRGMAEGASCPGPPHGQPEPGTGYRAWVLPDGTFV